MGAIGSRIHQILLTAAVEPYHLEARQAGTVPKPDPKHNGAIGHFEIGLTIDDY